MASKRGLSKMKTQSAEFDGFLPLLAVTAEHHISVLGKRFDNTKNNNDDSDTVSAPKYQELSSLQYISRPSTAGAFFPKPVNGKVHPDDLPKIAAILDTKNDLMYAVQHGNRRLCCWNASEASGPDEPATLKVELQSPILSLSLISMNKSFVYGTCKNGDAFVAGVVTGPVSKKRTQQPFKSTSDMELSVDYLPSRQPKDTLHIGTLAEVRLDGIKASGRKRKTSDADGKASVILYQAFHDDTKVYFVRHAVTVSIHASEIGLIRDTLVQAVGVIVDLEPNGQKKLASAKLLTSISSSSPKAVLVYSVSDKRNGSDDEKLSVFGGSVCLLTASFFNSPMRIPADTNQFGLVADTVLACASRDTIYLHDLETGSFLQKKSVKKIVGEWDEEWVMKCDSKTSIIAILYPDHGELYTSFSSATLAPRDAALAQVKIKASSKLANSLLVTRTDATSILQSLDNRALHSEILKELETLRDCVGSFESGNGSLPLNKTFDECVNRLRAEAKLDSEDENGDANLPNERTTNGKCKRRKEDDLRSMQQAFIDGAVEITLEAFKGEKRCSSRKLSQLAIDSRSILRRLLRSGRVSARLHFEGSFPLRETSKKHPLLLLLQSVHSPAIDTPLSAMQLIVELLQNCHDLSERQLVILMNFMMRHPDPDDIAQAFTESSALQIKQMLKQDSKDYMAVRKENQCGNSTDSSEESEVAIGKKLVVAGVELVLHMILCYSECNEVMLRVALLEGLTSGREATVLAQLLARTLKTSPSVAPSAHRKNHNLVRSACQWIACLSDSFEDELKKAKTPSGDAYVTFLLDEVQTATRNSQAIISFKDSIGVAEAARKDLQKQEEKDAAKTKRWPVDDVLPGYAIERLVF
jgi:hypothetical protein